jgi:hypothetical protein
MTEMEEELLKSVKFIESRVSSLVKDETPFVEELDREKIREILHDVLTELYSKSDQTFESIFTQQHGSFLFVEMVGLPLTYS